jgi:hypothetical protein
VDIGSSRSFWVLGISKADRHYIHCAHEIWILRSLPFSPTGRDEKPIQELSLVGGYFFHHKLQLADL